jgi:hypothetical protein
MQESSNGSSSDAVAGVRLSAIPFSSSGKGKAKAKGKGRDGSAAAARNNGNSDNIIEWTDLTKEPLELPGHGQDAVAAMDTAMFTVDSSRPSSMSMPEDHLEDLLACVLDML